MKSIEQREKLLNLCRFLGGENVVLIHGPEDMKRLVDVLDYHRVDAFREGEDRLLWRRYDFWLNLVTAPQNRHIIGDGFDGKTLCAEFQSGAYDLQLDGWDDAQAEWWSTNSFAHGVSVVARGNHPMSQDREKLLDAFVKQTPFSVDDVDDR